MARASKTGVRGLYREILYFDAKGAPVPAREAHRREKAGEKFRTELGDWTIDFRWRDPLTGKFKRHTERLPSGIPAAAAKLRAQKVTAGALAGTFDPLASKKEQTTARTLGAELDRYLDEMRMERPASIVDRTYHAKQIRRVLGEQTRLNDISEFSVAKLRKDRSEAGAASHNRCFGTFKHFARRVTKAGHMTPEVEKLITSVARMKEPPGRVRWITPEEEALIMPHIPVNMRPIVRTALLAGLRRGNLVRLRKSQVDLKAMLITIDKTKTNKPLTIPIPPALVPTLEAAMKNPTEYMFPTRLRKPYRPGSVSSKFSEARQLAGLENVRFHDCRHTWATDIRRNGTELDVLKELGGWSSLSMVHRYAHVMDQAKREAVAKLGNNRQYPQPATAEPKTANDSDTKAG